MSASQAPSTGPQPAAVPPFGAAANAEARRLLAGRYLLHTLANAARLAREGDVGRLAGAAAGLPAVIAAAGPSLDARFHDLHAVRDKAVLIACDTAARPLILAGFEPHFVVALDPSLANASHLGALRMPRRTWLAAEGSLHPSAFAHFDGRTFAFRVADHHPWPWLRTAGIDSQRLDVWGSVITAAFSLALHLGCSPIVFEGADLAFSGGRPYCRGTTLEPQWAMWTARGRPYDEVFALEVDKWTDVREPDVHGQPVRTAPHLIEFRNWLVSRAAAAAPTAVVNASDAGILHGGPIRLARACDVLAPAAPLDADALDARIRAAHAQPDRRAALFAHIAALEAIADPAALRAWRAFAHDTLDAGELLAALRGHEYTAWRLTRPL